MALLYADMVDRHQVREKPRLRKKRFDLGTVQTKILNNDIRKKRVTHIEPKSQFKKKWLSALLVCKSGQSYDNTDHLRCLRLEFA